MLWAATLRGGPTAMLSHDSAAEVDQLSDRAACVIHLTVDHAVRVALATGERANQLPPIVVHRSRRSESIRHPARRPPRTRIEETTIDLAVASASLDDAIAWLARACGRRLTTAQALAAAAADRTRLRWRTPLVAALADIAEGAQSLLEVRYVRDVERPHGLPAARRQVRIRTGSAVRYLDNLYDRFGLVVELDGQVAHRAEDRWSDARRDNSHLATGLVTLRYGWADVTQRPCQTAREIGAVLGLRGWAGPIVNSCRICRSAAR